MSLAIDDYVYVHREGLYGRIKDIWEREETFLGVYGRIENIREETLYTVEFPWYPEDKVFEESLLEKLEVPAFRIGDVVTGLKGANAYGVTTEMAIMEVLRVEGDSMKVKILSHETSPRSVGFIYTVEPIWFKLARPRTNFYRGEKED